MRAQEASPFLSLDERSNIVLFVGFRLFKLNHRIAQLAHVGPSCSHAHLLYKVELLAKQTEQRRERLDFRSDLHALRGGQVLDEPAQLVLALLAFL